MQVVVTLNAAFCERHRKLCPPSEELDRECGKVSAVVGVGGSRAAAGLEVALDAMAAHIARRSAAGITHAVVISVRARHPLLPTQVCPCLPAWPAQAEALLKEYDERMAELMADLPDPCHDTGKILGWLTIDCIPSSALR
jgi:hypothetical protein